MRWPTSLFLLLGAAIGVYATYPECKRNEIPANDLTCEINWRSRTEKEALATCLEYIPTTFVKGKMNGDKTECTIQVAYQCAGNHKAESFIMFDKCYWFPKKDDKYIEGKITDHASVCDDGELSVFYSSTHAKFLGMKAHSMGIDKIWIGIDAEGKSIKDPSLMIHKKLWKLVEGDYWNTNEELKTFPKDGKVPKEASHYFMRTRTDYVNNRWQGSFERANGANFKAAYVCHTEAKFNDKQQWYCDKMGKDGLGLDALFDPGNEAKHEKPRCLYVSASSYTFNGKFDNMAKGCKESPSDLHSAGMDDGAGGRDYYKEFKNKGPLRIAAFRIDRSNTKERGYSYPEKCNSPFNGNSMESFIKWRHFDHHGNIQRPHISQMHWPSRYPSNECSDFPGESTTMGVKNGNKIDLPAEVRAPAICSIWFFQECENKKPCRPHHVCTNLRTYYEDPDYKEEYKGFYKCDCPKPNGIINGLPKDFPFKIVATANEKRTCIWHDDKYCAWFDFVGQSGQWKNAVMQNLDNNDHRDTDDDSSGYDTLQQVIVREGCRVSTRTWHVGRSHNYDLLHEVTYGVYEVPTNMNGKLLDEWHHMGVVSAQCWCP